MFDTTKVRAIWEVVELVVEELVQAAEVMTGSKTGAEKKAFVVSTTMEFLRKLEDSKNLLPAAFEGIVFTGLEFALGFLVERVLLNLKTAGAVPAAA